MCDMCAEHVVVCLCGVCEMYASMHTHAETCGSIRCPAFSALCIIHLGQDLSLSLEVG